MRQQSGKRTKQKSENDLRFLPLAIAAFICFIIAVSSGYGVWYFLGSKSPRNLRANISINEGKPTPSTEIAITAETPAATVSPAISNAAENNQSSANPSESPLVQIEPSPNPEKTEEVLLLAPAGELPVAGGEVVLGGGETKLPLKRENVDSFAIAETEVTNKQFREFIETTKAKIKLPIGDDDEPITNVSWNEAKAYCRWLSQKINAEVRLPTEAEWELAARGEKGLKYPWGDQWQDDGADCKENNGKVKPVKSHPNGKSPFGAYDMVGNVWEWTIDAGRDEFGKIAKYKGADSAFANETVYVIKGGAAVEAKINNTAQARISVPANFKSPDIGFRYVVLREKLLQSSN